MWFRKKTRTNSVNVSDAKDMILSGNAVVLPKIKMD